MNQRTSEVLRYLGAKNAATPEALEYAKTIRRTADRFFWQLDEQLTPKGLYRLFPLRHEPDGETTLLDSHGQSVLTLPGQLAKRLLADCQQAALLLATLGTPFDALLRTQQARDMAEATILDACGNVLVEELCDQLEQNIQQAYPQLYLTDRFSPGYGDLPLGLQRELLAALDAHRQAGICLTDSCLMTPAKSVTAIVGLARQPQAAKIRGCAYCTLRDHCTFRKDGKRCDSF